MGCNQHDLMDVLIAIGRLISCYLCCVPADDDQEPDVQNPLISDESDGSSRRVDDWLSQYDHSTVSLPEGFAPDPTIFQTSSDEAESSEISTTSESSSEIQEVYEKLDVSPSHAAKHCETLGTVSGSPKHTRCCTLLETPSETRKVSEKLEVSTHAATHYESLGKECGSPEHTPIRSFMSEEKEVARKDGSEFEMPCSTIGAICPINNSTITAVIPELPSAATQRKNKFVHFEIQVDTGPSFSRSLLSKTTAQNSEHSNSYGSDGRSNDKSCLTPLYITDDMQTPGTVYASNHQNHARWKVRSQYVHSVPKPFDNISPWRALKKEDLNTQKQEHVVLSLEQHENANPEHTSVSRTNFSGKFHSRTSDMDSPILGIVTQHLDYDEPSHISDKLLVLDQNVSFHATTLIERLEKSWSEETVICQAHR